MYNTTKNCSINSSLNYACLEDIGKGLLGNGHNKKENNQFSNLIDNSTKSRIDKISVEGTTGDDFESVASEVNLIKNEDQSTDDKNNTNVNNNLVEDDVPEPVPEVIQEHIPQKNEVVVVKVNHCNECVKSVVQPFVNVWKQHKRKILTTFGTLILFTLILFICFYLKTRKENKTMLLKIREIGEDVQRRVSGYLR